MSFQIKPYKKETENKTIRFPIPLIDKIEKAIRNKDVTFSRFVIQACEYALNNMEYVEKNSKKDNKWLVRHYVYFYNHFKWVIELLSYLY